MPVANYSVLKGSPTAGKVVSGASAHYQITLQADRTYTVAVNIESVDGSEVLYAVQTSFTPPDEAGLEALAEGLTSLSSEPGGLALDYVRSLVNGAPLITRAEMTTLPIASSSQHFLEDALSLERDKPLAHREGDQPGVDPMSAHALQNAVVDLLNQAVADPGSVIYTFGSAFADGGVTDGLHDIHMNQGNPVSNHGGANGTWQDGALFVRLPQQSTWTAVFIAFQTESWTTDTKGDPT